MRSKMLLVAVGAVSALMLTACGGGSGSSGHSSNSSGTVPSAAVSVPSTTPSPAIQGTYIVLSTCDASTGTNNLAFIDPATGAAVKTRHFTTGSTQYSAMTVCTASDNTPGSALRSAFDKNFERLAAQQNPPDSAKDNGAYHTGTIAASDEPGGSTDFTDLSGDQSDPNGFGTSIQQSAGAFAPDGTLYFVQKTDDGEELMAADPNGGKPRDIKKLVIPGNNFRVVDDSLVGLDHLYFVHGDNRPQVFDSRSSEVVCQDGWGFWLPGDSYLHYGPIGTKGTKVDLTMDDTLGPIGCADHQSFYDFSDGTLYRVTVKGHTLKKTRLLPKTEGDISEPTVSPDGKQIVFIFKKNDQSALYLVSAAGGTPEALPAGAVPNGTKIISWEKIG